MIEKNTARLSGVLLALLAICGCFRDVEVLVATRVTKVADGNLAFQQPKGLFFIRARAASLRRPLQ